MHGKEKEILSASIVDRFCLNKGSTKETWHIVLDVSGGALSSGGAISFSPGDSLAILPKNPQEVVENLFSYFNVNPSQEIVDPRTHKRLPISHFLRESVELTKVSLKLVEALTHHAYSLEDRKRISAEELQFYHGYRVDEFLQLFAGSGAPFEKVLEALSPLRPRLYSIASSPSVSQHRLELIVRKVSFEGKVRPLSGLCSKFLIEEATIHNEKIPCFVHRSHHFSLPEENVPLIMIGGGTGVAPFRAFMQERGKVESSENWLFFGERNKATDFFFEEFWKKHEREGRLKLNVAFSRDQDEKIYVQHELWNERKKVWEWLHRGARLYVCGSAHSMAKDVEHCLLKIAQDLGALHNEASSTWLKELRQNKRYLKDVY